MEFCLSVKSIINIQDFTLPFMGVLIAAPSSMKTMVIQLFRKYLHTFYTDSFTPSSLVSHNSAKTEEELQKVDMLPKLKNKLVLTPELAPIITAKEDDLQKVMGIITRLLDGHGLENDSGVHGHRKYGDTMFVWLGAAVEIPPRVWKLLGTLGHKIYFIRPALRKKSIQDLIKIAKSNNFSSVKKEIEDALLDYLRTFDAAPDIDGKIKVQNGIVKVEWNEEIEEEQAASIGHIAQLANLLAPLRGTVYVSESRYSNRKNYSNAPNQQQPQQIEGQDYDTDFPTIEDPSRAVILLRNIAIGHAVSQGRNRINLEDIPIVIKVALSTAPVRRVKVLDLLIKSGNGELSTSQITGQLSISQPIATRTMREFNALGIVDISAIGNYDNSELKITLKPEFEWFRGKEFLNLKEGYVPSDDDESDFTDRHNENIDDDDANTNLFTLPPPNQDTINNNGNVKMESCDSNLCHTLKLNSPPKAHENNNSCHNQKETEQKKIIDKNLSNIFNLQGQQQPQDNANTSLPEKCNQMDEFNNNITTTTESFKEKDNAPPIPKSFEHVTASHEKNCHTSSEIPLTFKENNDEVDSTSNSIFQEILDKTKLANGSSISFNSVIESACENSEAVRNYLGDKLTSRENRLVRDLQLRLIRQRDVEVIKYKPQLLVRWNDADSVSDNKGEVI
jgi:hypothetical protein